MACLKFNPGGTLYAVAHNLYLQIHRIRLIIIKSALRSFAPVVIPDTHIRLHFRHGAEILREPALAVVHTQNLNHGGTFVFTPIAELKGSDIISGIAVDHHILIIGNNRSVNI